MRLSTSSSDERVFAGPWLGTWLLACVFAALGLGAYELFLRDTGHRPSVVDDADLWCSELHRLKSAGDDSVVLLGASRMTLGVDPEQMSRELDVAVVQLAIDGANTVDMLGELAKRGFSGKVVYSATPPKLVPADTAGEQDASLVANLDHCASWGAGGVDNRFDSRVGAFLQSKLAVLNPSAGVQAQILSLLKNRHLQRPRYLVTDASRSRRAFFAETDVEQLREERLRIVSDLAPLGQDDAWFSRSRTVEGWIDTLIENGADVLILRLPVDPELYELEQARAPRSRFWDRFAKSTRARMVHFEDEESLRDYDCPDASHIDQKDRPRLTSAIARMLR